MSLTLVCIGMFIVPLSLVFLDAVAAKAVDGVVPVVSYNTLAGVAVERHGHASLQCVERNINRTKVSTLKTNALTSRLVYNRYSNHCYKVENIS